MGAKMEPGTYQCRTTAATIYEAPSGAVMLRLALDIGLTGGICLIQKDGTLSERGFKDAQAILGLTGTWDWDIWGQREPEEWAGHDCEAVVETVQGERGEFSSVKYVNAPGGGAAMTKADGKSLAAKYGAKTRALFGGAPAAPKPAAPKPPPPAPKPPAAPAATSSMESCWERFAELNASRTELDLYAMWPKLLAEAGVSDQNSATPADWGRVLAHVNGNTLPV